MKIVDIREVPELFEQAYQFIWGQWGEESNARFYRDCMEQACRTEEAIPRFYLALEGDTLMGSYALLRSDLNSRQDLSPWFACLFVDPEHRGQGLGGTLQQHALAQAKEKGYRELFLCTDLTGYYERQGWDYIGKGYLLDDSETRIYSKAISK